MDDAQLLDQELRRLTVAGWQIVSQSERGFQVMMPHVVGSGVSTLLVIVPLGLGIFAALFSAVWGSMLFSLALVLAALLALDHIGHKPRLLYITADQLRQPPTLVKAPNSVTVCPRCYRAVRPNAARCPDCHVEFAPA